MRTIKIISGVFGYHKPNSRAVTPKKKSDPPFEVEDKLAARLVSSGIAEYVGAVIEPALDPGGDGEKEPPAKPVYSIEQTAKELKALLDELGISYPSNITKEKLVEMLDEYYTEDIGDDENENDSEKPNLDSTDDIVL
jgi:hypothetical protein